MNYLIEVQKEVENFLLNDLKHSIKLKFIKIFRRAQEGWPIEEVFSLLPGTTGIFEFKLKDGNAIFKILSFMVYYEGDRIPTIILTNGFIANENGTPQSEIDKAENIKKNY